MQVKESDYPGHSVFVNLRKRICKKVLDEIARLGARISGSIILQAHYSVNWNSDVDIYECVPIDYAKTARSGKFSPLEDFFYNNGGITEDTAQYDYSEYDPWLRIAQTRSYRLEDVLYQVIGVAECESEDQFRGFLQTVFDFPICKNYVQFDENGLMTLWMEAPDDVTSRKTTLQFGIRPCETLERVKKYRERGITIIDDGSAIPPEIRTEGVFVREPMACAILPKTPINVGGGFTCRADWFNDREGKLVRYSKEDPRCKLTSCAAEPHVHVTAQVDYGRMREIRYMLMMLNDPV
jgi:hypothetical protein